MPWYVKANYDFSTSESGEISLNAADIVKVLKQVDSNWLKGEIRGKVGNFPANFVTKLDIPTISNGQKVFVAVRSFPAEVQGDLGFQKGDILIGTRSVDTNWWEGKCGTNAGIFPVTHVQELEFESSANNTPSDGREQNVQSSTALSEGMSSPNAGSSSKVGYDSPVAVTRANMDLTAQLDDELSVHSGDIVRVLELIDSDFCVGECNGKKGQVPVWCLDVIEGSLHTTVPTRTEKRKSRYKWWEKESGTDVDVENNQTIPLQDDSNSTISSPVNAPTVFVSNASSQSQTVKNHIENIKNEVIQSDNNNIKFEKTHKRNRSYTMESTRSYDSAVTPYGRTLFPFIAENPNELTFFDNEIIVLIRYVDDQWMEGEVNGQRGIFPINYIDIIVDCPHVTDTSLSAPKDEENGPADISSSKVNENNANQDITVEEYGKDVYGRVLYDFMAESDRDLNMSEGDTVTVLRKLNEHWFEARHDNGKVGLCPVSYVELISEEPSTPVESPSVPKSCLPSGFSQEKSASPVKHTYINIPVEDNSRISTEEYIPSNADTVQPAVTLPSITEPSVTKPALAKPKPGLKPKPHLKPKPTLIKSTSVGHSASTSPNVPKVSSQIGRKSLSIDSDTSSRGVQSEGNKRLSMPVFSQSQQPVLQGSLGNKESEFWVPGTGGNSDQIPKPRTLSSSSTDSAKSPIVTVVGDSVQFSVSKKRPQIEPLNIGSLSTGTGQSQFFGSAGLIPHSSADESRMTGNASAGRGIPLRPPPPPASAQVRRPAPARPVGRPSLAPAPSKTPLISPPASAVDYGPKPVPQRPAPPRPNQRPGMRVPVPSSRSPSNRQPQNLMDFSPERVTAESAPNITVAGSGRNEEYLVDVEVITDLQNRIEETEKDIEKHSNAKSELEQMLLVVDEADKPEIEENIQFYDANLSGLTQELTLLKQNLCEVCPSYASAEAEAARREEEARKRVEEERKRQEAERREREELRQKRVAKRQHVIEELLQTEQDYLQSLNHVMHVFLSAGAEKCPSCDLETLFGNMDEVVEVSQKLLTSLETATKGKEFKDEVIGESFVRLKEDMKKVYAPYCRNHDDVIALLGKYEEIPEIQEYFNRQIDIMKQQATVFDLGSCLIKPVQRVLKYPLLLNELIQATEEDHLDKKSLIEAIHAMTDVASAINEYKRRKDLVLKYRKDADLRFSDKIARFGAHSAKKKLNRLTQKMVGVLTVDDDFNRKKKKVPTATLR